MGRKFLLLAVALLAVALVATALGWYWLRNPVPLARIVAEFPCPYPSDAAFSDDGRRLAIRYNQGAALYDITVAPPRLLRAQACRGQGHWTLIARPNTVLVAELTDDPAIALVDLADGQVLDQVPLSVPVHRVQVWKAPFIAAFDKANTLVAVYRIDDTTIAPNPLTSKPYTQFFADSAGRFIGFQEPTTNAGGPWEVVEGDRVTPLGVSARAQWIIGSVDAPQPGILVSSSDQLQLVSDQGETLRAWPSNPEFYCVVTIDQQGTLLAITRDPYVLWRSSLDTLPEWKPFYELGRNDEMSFAYAQGNVVWMFVTHYRGMWIPWGFLVDSPNYTRWSDSHDAVFLTLDGRRPAVRVPIPHYNVPVAVSRDGRYAAVGQVGEHGSFQLVDLWATE